MLCDPNSRAAFAGLYASMRWFEGMKRTPKLTALAAIYALFGVLWLVLLMRARGFFFSSLLPVFERTPTGYTWKLGGLIPSLWIILSFASAYGFWKRKKVAVVPGIIVAATYAGGNVMPAILGVNMGPVDILVPIVLAAIPATLIGLSWNQLS